MLTELCGVLRNWFETDRISGTYTVENGSIALPFLQEGQFFRIVGSVFNDGVHQYPDYGRADETCPVLIFLTFGLLGTTPTRTARITEDLLQSA